MAFSERALDDYVDVAQRIADFRALYPQGCLQPLDPASPWEVATVEGVAKDGSAFTATMIVYVAAAYRTPDDTRPGIGCAWEVFPGRTSFTLGSELMNAETSAWGRAIVAVLASDSERGVASRQEVEARRAEREDGLPVNADGSLSRSQTTDAQKDAAGVMTDAQLKEHTALGGGHPKERKTPAADRAKVTRLHPDGPADDPWTLTPEQRPGSIGPGQQHKIMAALGKLPRAERLAEVSRLAGRGVTTTDDLSYAEAQKVLAGIGGGK